MPRSTKKLYILRVTFGVLSLAIMGLIFWFSSQDATQSGSLSASVSGTLRPFLEGFLPLPFVDFLLKNLRKLAHIFLFACLGTSLSLFTFTFPLQEWLKWVLPVAGSFLYACSDEFHQTFVVGRAGLFTDVLIDGIGFLSATVIANGVRLLVCARAQKKEQAQGERNNSAAEEGS